ARKLYGRADLEWRSPEQGDAIATIVSCVEQVIIVLPTGAGKSLLFMLPCTLPDSGVTVLVVPLVSLRGDLLRRLGELGVDHLVWRPGEQRDASLVLVTVEAACTRDFVSYAQRLVATQLLDWIVVDESHLTVTASEYRESMVELASIRKLRAQFVYLTATLPPSMQAEFGEQNYLLDPKVIRASTNRPNIFYMVGKAVHGAGSLLQQGAAKAREAWHESGLFDASKDKIVLYVRTLAEADELASLLGCSSYTSESGTSEEKEEILAEWVQSADKPYIVATSALSAGFDHPHVRLVMHINEPDSLIDFAQESGRAGRDGREAYSFVLLPTGWRTVQGGPTAENVGKAGVSARKGLERKAMHRYLRGGEWFRTCLSDHLDLPRDRRWCMEGEDVACSVCTVGHRERIGP
ncbi:P-loop containing nucleoside triphosphate hydrolase protein, partial [Cryomyces antarcticus]